MWRRLSCLRDHGRRPPRGLILEHAGSDRLPASAAVGSSCRLLRVLSCTGRVQHAVPVEPDDVFRRRRCLHVVSLGAPTERDTDRSDEDRDERPHDDDVGHEHEGSRQSAHPKHHDE
jgi:hypothetical protein